MIATTRHAPTTCHAPKWHQAFLQMMPIIIRHARCAFRDYDPESREELVQETVANCLAAYARLVKLGKQGIAYPMVLARYAVAQINDGRKVGGRLNTQ